MKIKVYTHTPTDALANELFAVKKWYAEKRNLDIDFFIEFQKMDNLQWYDTERGENPVVVSWTSLLPTLRKLPDYDLIVYIVPSEHWPEKNKSLGYAATMNFEKTYFTAICDTGKPRTANKGWENNNQISGTVRHEISHILNMMLNSFDGDDLTHEYDLTKNKLEELPIDIDSIIFKQFAKCEDWNLAACKKAAALAIITQFTNEPITDTRLAVILNNLNLLTVKK